MFLEQDRLQKFSKDFGTVFSLTDKVNIDFDEFSIHHRHRRWLHFVWRGLGPSAWCSCLQPCPASWVFTKLVKEFASYSWEMHFAVHCFLDDLLVLANRYSKFTDHTLQLLAKSDFLRSDAESAVSAAQFLSSWG